MLNLDVGKGCGGPFERYGGGGLSEAWGYSTCEWVGGVGLAPMEERWVGFVWFPFSGWGLCGSYEERAGYVWLLWRTDG